jgi:hypothetical protein
MLLEYLLMEHGERIFPGPRKG